ncbi:MAG: outer membrane beta-barrel protein [Pseudomonadota bacterium]
MQRLIWTLAVLGIASAAPAAVAEGGGYIGVAAGGATFEASAADIDFGGVTSDLDEDDTAWEVFAGYRVDLPFIDVGVEVGYVDFGEPEVDIGGTDLVFDPTGFNVWGTLGFDLGPLDVYGKLGLIDWDVDQEFGGLSATEDGTDVAYGIGIGAGLGPIQFRGEYEIYEFDDVDLSLVTLGVVYFF